MTQTNMHNHMELILYYLFVMDHNVLIIVEESMNFHMIQILMASQHDVKVFYHPNQYVCLIKINLIPILISLF